MTIGLISVLLAALAILVALGLLQLLRQGHAIERLRLLAEQGLAGQRAEAETARRDIAATVQSVGGAVTDRMAAVGERAVQLRGELNTGIETIRTVLSRDQGELRLVVAQGHEKTGQQLAREFEVTRAMVEARLKEMRESNETKLTEIQRGVNEQLHAAVEKQMNESFARVVDQFTAVQKAMGDVQAVTTQIADIKRLFSNVKARGGWGETQVRAMLDDILPPGAYETNCRLSEDNNEMVEFALIMPMRGDSKPYLAVDAKFPVEDYERLLAASDAGDAEAERAARTGLERRIRAEAAKIQQKYICPPATVDFAVLYVPTDALYAEIARLPGVIDELGRINRVLVLGPTLLPALLRTIQLGYVTLMLERNTDRVMDLLGATRTEMIKMDEILERLSKQAGTFASTIDKARVRTRAVGRKLKSIEVAAPETAERLLELDPGDDFVAELETPA
jgi:DNA recombination protein RmuC